MMNVSTRMHAALVMSVALRRLPVDAAQQKRATPAVPVRVATGDADRRADRDRRERRRRADADGERRSAGDGNRVRGRVPAGRLGGGRGRCSSVSIRGRCRTRVDQARATLARDEAQATAARHDAERYATLADKGYVTRSQAEQMHATALAQAATVEADRAALRTAERQPRLRDDPRADRRAEPGRC